MELRMIELTKRYGTKTAVNHLNLTLSGGIYGLLGENGAGKTTLMRLLCGIQKPTGGRILLSGRGVSDGRRNSYGRDISDGRGNSYGRGVSDGRDILELGENYRRLLGYLPQHFTAYPDFTSLDFLRYAASLKGLEEHQAEERAKELLEAVGLRAEEKCRIRTLSGGMKQRLGIAQALLNDPRILILDEPTVGLDPKERVRFQNMIRRFSGDRKDRMILLSTHILSDVEQIADEMIVMKSGQIVYCGEAEKRETKIFIKEWISDEKSD